MGNSIDILHLFPDLAAISQQQVQVYCDEWLQRPVAKEYEVAQIIVDHELMLHVSLESRQAVHAGEHTFLPIDELLGYIVDCHFQDADKRRELHTEIREMRRQWGEMGRDYEATVGRVRQLWLTCKNPECGADLETKQWAAEHQTITCLPTKVTCLVCGSTHEYEGHDLRLRPAT